MHQNDQNRKQIVCSSSLDGRLSIGVTSWVLILEISHSIQQIILVIIPSIKKNKCRIYKVLGCSFRHAIIKEYVTTMTIHFFYLSKVHLTSASLANVSRPTRDASRPTPRKLTMFSMKVTMLFQLLHLPFWNVGSLSHILPEPSTANTISSFALAQVGGGVGGGGVDGLGVTHKLVR